MDDKWGYPRLWNPDVDVESLWVRWTARVVGRAAVPEEVATLPQVQRKLRKLEEVDQQLARQS